MGRLRRASVVRPPHPRIHDRHASGRYGRDERRSRSIREGRRSSEARRRGVEGRRPAGAIGDGGGGRSRARWRSAGPHPGGNGHGEVSRLPRPHRGSGRSRRREDRHLDGNARPPEADRLSRPPPRPRCARTRARGATTGRPAQGESELPMPPSPRRRVPRPGRRDGSWGPRADLHPWARDRPAGSLGGRNPHGGPGRPRPGRVGTGVGAGERRRTGVPRLHLSRSGGLLRGECPGEGAGRQRRRDEPCHARHRGDLARRLGSARRSRRRRGTRTRVPHHVERHE